MAAIARRSLFWDDFHTMRKEMSMNETERAVINSMTAVQGELPNRVGGHDLRRVSLESISVLQLVGSPFAPVFNAALNGETVPPVKADAVALAVFAWVHSAPADDVLHTALECTADYNAPAVEAAMRWIRGWTVEEVGAVVEAAMQDAKAVEAANFDMAAPSLGGASGGKKKR